MEARSFVQPIHPEFPGVSLPKHTLTLTGLIIILFWLLMGDQLAARPTSTQQKQLANVGVQSAADVDGGKDKLRSLKTIWATVHGYQNHLEDSEELQGPDLEAPPLHKTHLEVPVGHAISVDGIASPGEWDDAGWTEIVIHQEWEARVHYKHDNQNMYFMFEGVKHGNDRLFPEIVIDPQA